jgi:hypothetical protein
VAAHEIVSNVWNEPWEKLLSARGTGARRTALFIGRIRGKLSLKELGQLEAGFISTLSAPPFVFENGSFLAGPKIFCGSRPLHFHF